MEFKFYSTNNSLEINTDAVYINTHSNSSINSLRVTPKVSK